MKQLKVGPLSVTLVGQMQSPKHIFVLCHGYGAPGDDLVGLAHYLMQTKPELAEGLFVFPEAPHTIPGMPFGGRAWWQIDMLARGQIQSLEELNALFDQRPDGLDSARDALSETVEILHRQFGVAYAHIFLGGFSQGAMLATDTFLSIDKSCAGLIVLSGTLLGTTWKNQLQAKSNSRVFQSHGKHDPILLFSRAQQLQVLLEEHTNLSWVPFVGQHEIPLDVLTALADFLGAKT